MLMLWDKSNYRVGKNFGYISKIPEIWGSNLISMKWQARDHDHDTVGTPILKEERKNQIQKLRKEKKELQCWKKRVKIVKMKPFLWEGGGKMRSLYINVFKIPGSLPFSSTILAKDFFSTSVQKWQTFVKHVYYLV